MRVADDGAGMDRRDAILALERHATSKITEASDLRSVATFGFRGEALPSIAAVSRMVIDTCGTFDDTGTRVRVNGGTISSVEDFARMPGTTVEVRSIFFNAPARAKFMKPAAAEARVAAEALTGLAVANPRTGFVLRSGKRTLLDLPPAKDLRDRVRDLWGADAASTLVEVESEATGYAVRGLVQRPDAVRSGVRRAYVVVGSRPVKDFRLLRAAERGYLTTIPPTGAQPWVLLFFDTPHGSVDVNVHPAKAEVRFRDPEVAEELVEHAVRAVMGGYASAAILSGGAALGGDRAGGHRDGADGGRGDGSASSRSSTSSIAGLEVSHEADGAASPGLETVSASEARTRGGEALPRAAVDAKRGEAVPAAADTSGGAGERAGRAYPEGGSGAGLEVRDRLPFRQTGPELVAAGKGTGQGTLLNLDRGRFAPVRMWQALNTYILAEVSDGLLVVDQHSAHERVLFHRLMEQFTAGRTEAQRLLFPVTVQLTEAEVDQVLQLRDVLARTGFETEIAESNAVVLSAAPNPHPYFDAEVAFREMVAELATGSELTRSAKNQYERIAMTFACKSAIRAGQPLSEAEMRELFDRLFSTDLPYHDVHGRPTVVRLPAGELARRFGR